MRVLKSAHRALHNTLLYTLLDTLQYPAGRRDFIFFGGNEKLLYSTVRTCIKITSDTRAAAHLPLHRDLQPAPSSAPESH